MEFTKFIKVILLSVLCSFSALQIAYAQETQDIQYVTGKLRLSLYEQADSSSDTISLLASGDRLDVIETAGPYAKVITDSEKEGWVKRGFLVKTKPALILYNELNVKHKELQNEMKSYEERNNSLSDLELQLEALNKENAELKVSNENFVKKEQRVEKKIEKALEVKTTPIIDLEIFIQFFKEYLSYFSALFVLLLLIGYRIGEIKTESQVMKHFGGIKVW